MSNPVFVQIQFLLAAVAALLPMAPEAARARIAPVLDLAAQALRLVDAGARNLDELAEKLRRIRADIERLAESGGPVTPTQLDDAFARVQAASAALRNAAADLG